MGDLATARLSLFSLGCCRNSSFESSPSLSVSTLVELTFYSLCAQRRGISQPITHERTPARHLLLAFPGSNCHPEYRRNFPDKGALLGGHVGVPFGQMLREGFVHLPAAELEGGQ